MFTEDSSHRVALNRSLNVQIGLVEDGSHREALNMLMDMETGFTEDGSLNRSLDVGSQRMVLIVWHLIDSWMCK